MYVFIKLAFPAWLSWDLLAIAIGQPDDCARHRIENGGRGGAVGRSIESGQLLAGYLGLTPFSQAGAAPRFIGNDISREIAPTNFHLNLEF